MIRRTNPRTLVRPWAVVAAAAAVTALTTGPAAALTPDEGAQSDQLTTVQWLLCFIGIPALVIVFIWLLWSLPEWLRRGRGGSGVSWLNEPTWFGAVEGDDERPALTAGATAALPGDGADVERTGGGAHARW